MNKIYRQAKPRADQSYTYSWWLDGTVTRQRTIYDTNCNGWQSLPENVAPPPIYDKSLFFRAWYTSGLNAGKPKGETLTAWGNLIDLDNPAIRTIYSREVCKVITTAILKPARAALRAVKKLKAKGETK